MLRSLLHCIKSVTKPWKSLILTFFLFIVVEYWFSLIAYTFLHDHFPPEECASTIGCFLTMFDKGFKSDGGIGSYMDGTDGLENSIRWNKKNHNNEILMGRLIYDNLFNIIVMIIMMNIV